MSVRMAKTIGVIDGGGRILNSEGQLNEKEVFRKPARWVDYSGAVAQHGAGVISAGIMRGQDIDTERRDEEGDHPARAAAASG